MLVPGNRFEYLEARAALDAVEAGAMVPEADPTDTSVGYGGLPDRDGRVTVDACVMDEKGQCGSVMGLEDILHPVKVARLVMEQTPHVQFVGEGALQFALSKGFERTNLLTPKAEKAASARVNFFILVSLFVLLFDRCPYTCKILSKLKLKK